MNNQQFELPLVLLFYVNISRYKSWMSREISMYLFFIITFKTTLCFQKTERAWRVTHILLGFVITNTPEPDCLKYRQLNEVFGQRLVRLAEKNVGNFCT